jgi:NAD(P)-dependent dehydrogenase (short-subunit alcohol dehydrogenase family)
MSTSKKIALITGANRGLGLEMARQLGEQGITVLITARDAEKGKAAAATLAAEGIDARALELDVTDSSQLPSIVAQIEQEFGRLDILINNAGMIDEGSDWSANTTLTTSAETLHKTFETNFFSVVAITQALLPLLWKAPAARIVNMSSILGSLALHAAADSPIYSSKLFGYNASKAALNSFTIHLAHALRDTPIKVNSAHPGWVKTEMGTEAATMEIPEGAKTGVTLATLPADGPTGGYFHLGKPLPW